MSARDKFIGVGENIHCTRIYKVGGKYVKESGTGGYAIFYTDKGQEKSLPIPEEFTKKQDWENGKVKHTAVAIWQGVYGSGDAATVPKTTATGRSVKGFRTPRSLPRAADGIF